MFNFLADCKDAAPGAGAGERGGRRRSDSVGSSRRSSGVNNTGLLLADNTADLNLAFGRFEVRLCSVPVWAFWHMVHGAHV